MLQVTKPEVTECSDGIDNDRNGKCDTVNSVCINSSVTAGDSGCTSTNDLVEDAAALACADGIDNDNDGLVDSNDPGCSEPFNLDNSEVDGECTTDWTCDPWSICSSAETQTRLCRDLNACGEECTEGDVTCATTRPCPAGNGTDIDLPDTGKDDTETSKDQEDILSNPCSVNNICEPEWGEDEFNCPEDCTPKGAADTTTDTEDISDGFEEDQEGSAESEDSSSRAWLYIVVILLILVLAGSYFFIFKKPAKKSDKELKKFRLPLQPDRSVFSAPKLNTEQPVQLRKTKKSGIEEELENSLKEAKKLLEK